MILRLFRKTNAKVPKPAKTLLETPGSPSTEIVDISGGRFWYNGIGKSLYSYFRFKKLRLDEISLNISIDGLPLYNSSNMQFWPILFNINEMPEAPVMTAAIFCGLTKPLSLSEYLGPMCAEINDLIEYGLDIAGKRVVVRLRAIIAAAQQLPEMYYKRAL
ncbi:AGAP007639-PA-like protein [Anopheles sinensis]|uniref:AGAP007639-PA-like protein n=1 Tax=Anopheles sinensis TaxID=74873 RepID=A0A084VAS5_ANOSI|nr:AGAP007639-PA-like protein [Anopheles sinensis]